MESARVQDLSTNISELIFGANKYKMKVVVENQVPEIMLPAKKMRSARRHTIALRDVHGSRIVNKKDKWASDRGMHVLQELNNKDGSLADPTASADLSLRRTVAYHSDTFGTPIDGSAHHHHDVASD